MTRITSILLAMVLALGILGAMPLAALAETPIVFPDANFEAAVRAKIGKPSGDIYPSDVDDVKELGVSWEEIGSLAGIEYFTSLERLDCRGNPIKTLDVSGFSKLISLNCENCFLSTLDLSGLSNLEELDCGGNNLSIINISGLSALRVIGCSENNLHTLDVSGLPKLRWLNCSSNSLSTLVVSGASELEYLFCNNNVLVALDASGLSSLRLLYCYSNNLGTLNVSGSSSLESLACMDNNLNTLDVSGLPDLKTLECYNNMFSKLDVSHNTELTFLSCSNNTLNTLDVSRLPKLETLACMDNNLETLDVFGLSKLERLYCRRNFFTSIDSIIGYENIKELYFDPQKGSTHTHSYGAWKTTKAATCTAAGTQTRTCASDSSHKETKAIAKLGHTGGKATCTAKAVCTRCKAAYGSLAAHKEKPAAVTKATTAKDGKYNSVCSVCSKTVKTGTVIPKVSSITLAKTAYAQDGKEKKPAVTVKDSKGKVLKSGTDYSVTYAAGRKNVGSYSVKITLKGNYSGTVTKTFKINPKATTGVKATKAATSIKLTWTKQSGVEGYQIYDTVQKKVVATVKGSDKNSVTISKLTAGKAYSYQVRAYKTVSGTKYYGAYSAVLKTSTLPATPKISSVSSSKAKNLTVKWGKVTSATGYEIQYSTDKTFKKSVTTKAISKNATVSATYSGLAAGKTYYVRIRTCKTINGAKVYSPYTAAKSVKIK